MAISSSTIAVLPLLLLAVLVIFSPSSHAYNYTSLLPKSSNKLLFLGSLSNSDRNFLEFFLNSEYYLAEFFLWGSLGKGLDAIAPELAGGGPVPRGVKLANLDPLTKDIILQFGYQEVGHIRAIKKVVKGFPRPLIDLSKEVFATAVDAALGKKLVPPFDPYLNGLNFLIASYALPYIAIPGYVGANSKLQSPTAKRLVAGLLAVESGQDGVLRALLYQRRNEIVLPYGIPVLEFANKISDFVSKLGRSGTKDEGLVVEAAMGAEGKIKGNVVTGNADSLGYERTPEEILRIVYATSSENIPGGFFPNGCDGVIAKSYLTV